MMENDDEQSKSTIVAGFYDVAGAGPDYVALALEDFPSKEIEGAFSDPEMHRAVHIVISADPDEHYNSTAAAMIGGAFSLDRESVIALHRQLGEWLRKRTEEQK